MVEEDDDDEGMNQQRSKRLKNVLNLCVCFVVAVCCLLVQNQNWFWGDSLRLWGCGLL